MIFFIGRSLRPCRSAENKQVTSFFAQARHEVSVWGCLLVEHHGSSTVGKPLRIQTYMVIVSKILDHTELRTNQLLPWKRLALVSDCGPHYRSWESLSHGLYDLEKMYSIPVEIHFGCEKHMNSGTDRLFGWTKAILQRAAGACSKLVIWFKTCSKEFIENKVRVPFAPKFLLVWMMYRLGDT